MSEQVDLLPDQPPQIVIAGFTVSPSPDGLGVIITAPPGKVINLSSPLFGISVDGKRLEVRAK